MHKNVSITILICTLAALFIAGATNTFFYEGQLREATFFFHYVHEDLAVTCIYRNIFNIKKNFERM